MIGLPQGLCYVSDAEPGIVREESEDGFCYRLPDGGMVRDEETLARIRALGIPPAYTDVWICLDAEGHLQATGFDARRRKQYRYHPGWQAHRSAHKYDQLLAFARALPKIRRRVSRDLSHATDHERAILAALAMLLDLAHIRVGNESYARENGTFGATTLEKRHVRLTDDKVELRFTAKGGKKVRHSLRHPRLQRVLERIADLPGRKLFSWKENGIQHAIDSGRLNAYLASSAGLPFSAKTFRTWGGTLAAFNLAANLLERGEIPTIKALCLAAAEELRNTPAICRKSYIHPRVLSLADPAGDPVGWFRKWRGRRRTGIAGLRADENRLYAFLRSRPISRHAGT